jgi:hypothetical protein
MSDLHGARELRRRLKAIKTVFKPAGREWADRTVTLAKRRVKNRTGKTQRSIRRRNASQRKAAVVATHGARFLEAGAKAHQIQPRRMKAMKFNVGGQPVFARKAQHPGARKQPFLHRSARESLEQTDILADLIELWNRAA